jgi:hypothetical protein
MQQIIKKINRRIWQACSYILVCGIITISSSGCLHTRGAMYLQKERVGVFLENTQEQAPAKGVDLETHKKWRERLANVPDGNRILGGFCAEDEQILTVLRAIDGLRPQCQQRLYDDASSANFQGRLFWGFLGGTVLAGTGTIIFAGLALSSDTAKTGLGITGVIFGITTLVGALTNTLGGFDARQERYKILARRLDNFMWTLRLRVMAEVCNAKDRNTAHQQVVYIYKMTQHYCTHSLGDDGTYRIPTGGEEFDKSLPSDPLPTTTPQPPQPPIPYPPDNGQPPPDNGQPPPPETPQ